MKICGDVGTACGNVVQETLSALLRQSVALPVLQTDYLHRIGSGFRGSRRDGKLEGAFVNLDVELSGRGGNPSRSEVFAEQVPAVSSCKVHVEYGDDIFGLALE